MEDLRNEISNAIKEIFLKEEVDAQSLRKDTKPKAIRFNPGLANEYLVTFSQRGFLIDNTRLSFEELENAISKEYIITLKGGTVLDLVKMQQILKYKNLF